MGQLILSRKRNEKIMIGDDISIMIVDIRGDQVQVGIDAPKGIPVHRLEVYEEIAQGNPPRKSRKKSARAVQK